MNVHKISSIVIGAMVASLFVAFLFGTSLVHAESCHSIKNNSQTPSGYASPVSFMTNDQMIRGDCFGQDVEIEVGNGSPLTYVYDTSYLWSDSEWSEVPLSGPNPQGSWIPGSAAGEFTGAESPSWYVAYTCEWIVYEWKCGCTSTACAENQWQIQALMTSELPSVPGLPELMGDDTLIPAFEHPTRVSSMESIPKGTIIAISELTPLNNLGVTPGELIDRLKRDRPDPDVLYTTPRSIKEARDGNSRWKDDSTLKSLGIDYPLFLQVKNDRPVLSYGAPDNTIGRLERTDDLDDPNDITGYGWDIDFSGMRGVYIKELLGENVEYNRAGKSPKTRLMSFEWDSLLPGQKITFGKDTKLKSLGITPRGNGSDDNQTIGDVGGQGYTIEIDSEGLARINGEIAETFGEAVQYVSDTFDSAYESLETMISDFNWDYSGAEEAYEDFSVRASVTTASIVGKAEAWVEAADASVREYLSGAVEEAEETMSTDEVPFIEQLEEFVGVGLFDLSDFNDSDSDAYDDYYSDGNDHGWQGNDGTTYGDGAMNDTGQGTYNENTGTGGF